MYGGNTVYNNNLGLQPKLFRIQYHTTKWNNIDTWFMEVLLKSFHLQMTNPQW